jgi:hypothetical protein
METLMACTTDSWSLLWLKVPFDFYKLWEFVDSHITTAVTIEAETIQEDLYERAGSK